MEVNRNVALGSIIEIHIFRNWNICDIILKTSIPGCSYLFYPNNQRRARLAVKETLLPIRYIMWSLFWLTWPKWPRGCSHELDAHSQHSKDCGQRRGAMSLQWGGKQVALKGSNVFLIKNFEIKVILCVIINNGITYRSWQQKMNYTTVCFADMVQ